VRALHPDDSEERRAAADEMPRERAGESPAPLTNDATKRWRVGPASAADSKTTRLIRDRHRLHLARVSIILNFVPAEHVAVVVEGVEEPLLLTVIARDVRRMLRHLVGRWRVGVRPAGRGQWRLELSGASGCHLWVFASPAHRLSEMVVEKLEEFLRQCADALRPTVL
jgi:hypothetical protein